MPIADMDDVKPRRWAPRLLVATLIVVPLAGAVIGRTHIDAWAAVLALMLGATMAAESIDSLRTGQAEGKLFSANRAQQPRSFWAHVVSHFLFAGFFVLCLFLIWAG